MINVDDFPIIKPTVPLGNYSSLGCYECTLLYTDQTVDVI